MSQIVVTGTGRTTWRWHGDTGATGTITRHDDGTGDGPDDRPPTPSLRAPDEVVQPDVVGPAAVEVAEARPRPPRRSDLTPRDEPPIGQLEAPVRPGPVHVSVPLATPHAPHHPQGV